MRISDWSSDVCSSDLRKTIAWITGLPLHPVGIVDGNGAAAAEVDDQNREPDRRLAGGHGQHEHREHLPDEVAKRGAERDKIDIHREQDQLDRHQRSEEHTSELQSLMRISYAVFCLKKKK